MDRNKVPHFYSPPRISAFPHIAKMTSVTRKMLKVETHKETHNTNKKNRNKNSKLPPCNKMLKLTLVQVHASLVLQVISMLFKCEIKTHKLFKTSTIFISI